MPRTLRSILAALAAGTMLLGACGDDGDDDSTPTTAQEAGGSVEAEAGTSGDLAGPMAQFLQDAVGMSSDEASCVADEIIVAIGEEPIGQALGDGFDFAAIEGPIADDLDDAMFRALESCGVEG